VSENLATNVTTIDVLAGRTAVISGGSRGIGLEIARTLARAGANIALIAKPPCRTRACRARFTRRLRSCVGLAGTR
jgi:NAD(P)-dependent dehydrogenase (short-subunit alcohol dehydrogenase family)